MKKKLMFSTALFLGLAVIALIFLPKNSGSVFGAQEKAPIVDEKSISNAMGVQEAFRKIYNAYKERVVFISTEQTVKLPNHPFFSDPFMREFFGQQIPNGNRTQKRTGLGTGFILSEDGYICTNHHVVAGMEKVKIKIGNDTYDAQVIGSDDRTDIALLKISPKEKLKPVNLGDSSSVQVGDWAIAIGNPFGLDKTFTVGVVSATGRKDVEMMGGTQSHIQTDASINPGNSGGPLINIKGEVIGINRMIYSQTGGNMGIGFAIPINTARTVLDQLKNHKKVIRGHIGVQIVPLTDEYAKELGLNDISGALVGSVLDGGPAAKAGIQVGDVIQKVNDAKIKNYGDLVEQIEKTPIGKTLKIQVWRHKSSVTLFITVKERS
jgi:serine protease Do